MRCVAAWALLALLLATPGAAAGARVELAASGGLWNGDSSVEVHEGATDVVVWVPAGARLHAVTVESAAGPSPASWRAASTEALRIATPNGTTLARVTFDVAPAHTTLATYVAPTHVDALTLRIRPPPGLVAESDDARFEGVAGLAQARVGPLGEGETVTVLVVPTGRVGELPVLVTVGVLAVVVLLGGIAWHKARPPLEGRAPERFLDHLGELQARLLPPAALFFALNLVYFVTGLRRVHYPAFDALAPTFGPGSSLAARAFDAFAERLVPAGVQLVALRPADAVLAQVQMALFLAFVTVVPLLLYEVGAFLGPGLLPRERRLAARVGPLVAGLFVAGGLVGYLVMAPLMIGTLYGFAPGLGATPLLAVSDLVSFALLIVIAFAIAFELPVLMYVLARLGVVEAKTFRKYLRHAVLVIFIVSGILTPDPSVVTQLLVALPLVGLYLVGALAAVVGGRARLAAA